MVAAFALGEKNKPLASGIVLGLGMVKFHLFLLWPLVLLVQRRWRMLFGLAGCAVVQLLLAVSVIGWGGLRKYVEFILGLDKYYSPERYVNVGTILVNLGIDNQPLLITLTLAVAGLVLWSARRSDRIWMTFALATAGSLLIGPHVYAYDGAMLLAPSWCAIFMSETPILRLAAATLCTPLPVLANIAGPPFACFTACVLLVFAIGLCIENSNALRRSHLILNERSVS
jgi:hypothetical protein